MKNHTDVMIFHMAICAGASQIAMMACRRVKRSGMEIKMINPRETFFDEIYAYVSEGEDIILVTPDLAAPSLDKFRRDFPERYISVGIAEQDLMQVASGLAASGKKVVAWGLNPFVVSRGYDQIRNTFSLMKLPVTIAGLHTGFSSAALGSTHVVITDLTLIRTLDGITCVNPADCRMARMVAEETLKNQRALYVRFDKDITWEKLGDFSVDFDDGVGCIHRGKDKIAIAVTGYHTKMVVDLLPEWQKNGIDPTIINIYAFPFDQPHFVEFLKEIDIVITVEEHVLQGGFGSAVLEAIADCGYAKKVKRLGIDITKGYPEWFGWRQDLQEQFGLDRESIKNKVMEIAKEG